MHPRQLQAAGLKENIFLRHKKSQNRDYFGKNRKIKSAHLFTVAFPGQNKELITLMGH